MMKTINYLAATVFMLASTAASAATVGTGPTVWAPNSADVDFLQLVDFGLTTNGGTLALFDEADISLTNALVIGEAGGQVDFVASAVPGSSDWIASFNGMNLTLKDDNNFRLGMKWGAGVYVTDLTWELQTGLKTDSYLITFRSGTSPDNFKTGQTLAVDVKVVPVPAAVWLFGSGLIGLVGVARRRA